jgi:hypothetical protein
MSSPAGVSVEATSSASEVQSQSAAAAVPAAAAPASAAADADHIDMSALGFFDGAGNANAGSDSDSSTRPPPRRLLRAEAVLSRRTARFLLVVETLQDENNHQAILRTADSFGIQHVWVVKTPVEQKHRARKKKQMAAQAELLAQGQQIDKHDTQKLIDTTSTVSMVGHKHAKDKDGEPRQRMTLRASPHH